MAFGEMSKGVLLLRPFDTNSQSAVFFSVPPVNPTIPKKVAICAFYAPLQKLNDKPKNNEAVLV